MAISALKWAWDFNHYVPLMLHFILQLDRKHLPMFSSKLINPSSLLSAFSTYTNMFMTSWRKAMLNTNNDMISIEFPISFKWVTKFGCIYKKKMPYWSPSEAHATLIWALQYHQGCGRQLF